MKTFLAFATAAFITSSVGALANTQTHIITLDGHCDQITLSVKKNLVAGTDDPGCEQGFGGGVIGNVKKFGQAIVAGVQFTAEPGVQFVFQISYPLETGGTWVLYDTTDGVTLSEVESGSYTLVSGADARPRGAEPVTSSLHR